MGPLARLGSGCRDDPRVGESHGVSFAPDGADDAGERPEVGRHGYHVGEGRQQSERMLNRESPGRGRLPDIKATVRQQELARHHGRQQHGRRPTPLEPLHHIGGRYRASPTAHEALKIEHERIGPLKAWHRLTCNPHGVGKGVCGVDGGGTWSVGSVRITGGAGRAGCGRLSQAAGAANGRQDVPKVSDALAAAIRKSEDLGGVVAGAVDLGHEAKAMGSPGAGSATRGGAPPPVDRIITAKRRNGARSTNSRENVKQFTVFCLILAVAA